MKEKNIRELAKRMGLISVENMCQYTITQLVYMVANKVNELVDEVWRFETDVQETLKTQNENIQYLLGEGLHLEVATVFERWVEDGTFDTLINHSALKKINERIDETNTQLTQKASNLDLETERKRIDLLTKLENGSTEGNAELLDMRIGVNGMVYDVSGESTRDSLNAIYNGLGGVNCKDITNLELYSVNATLGTIVDKNTILATKDYLDLVPTTHTKSGRNYIVYCSEPIKRLTTISNGVHADEGVCNRNLGFITPSNDNFPIYISVGGNFSGTNNKNVTCYCVDVTGTHLNQDNFMNFDVKRINNWYFSELNGAVKIIDEIENCGEVSNQKIWSEQTWTKVDDKTVNTPYDVQSTITFLNNATVGKRYAVLFTGVISKIRTIKNGAWRQTESVNSGLGFITIESENDSVSIETYSGGFHTLYCVDVTSDIQKEEVIKKYGANAIGFDCQNEKDLKILDLLNGNSSTANATNNWDGKKWIAYGDSITEQNSYVQKVAKKLGLKVTNKGIGGTTVSDITGDNTNAFCRDERINTFDTDANLVTIMGGTNDWNKTTIGDLTYNNGFDTSKFMGALATTIIKIQERCPNATIVLCSLIGGRGTQTGVNGNIPLADQFGQTSLDFAKATKEVAEFMNVEYCDTWSCGINNWNRDVMIEDGVHPTQGKGTDKIAIKLLGTLKSIEPLN